MSSPPPTSPDDAPAAKAALPGAPPQPRAPVSSAKRGRQLFQIGLGAAAAAMLYYALTAKVQDVEHLYLGEIIIALSVLPGLLWAKKGSFGLPLFEMYMLTSIGAYAIPMLSGQQEIRGYDADTITTSALAVVLYQIAANVAFFAVPARPKKTRFWRTEVISKDASRFLGYGMIVTTIYTIVVQFTDWIPSDLEGIVRAVCYGVGMLATFIQAKRWGEGELPYYDKSIFLFQVVLQVIFSWAALFLIQGITIMMIALLGYVSGSRRIPVLALCIALPITALFHNGKSAMRAKYWGEGAAPQVGLTDMPAFFGEWIGYGLHPPEETDESRKGIALLQRTSLIQMMCLVVSASPAHKPFLNGETYHDVLAQFVPRFFWPGKPHVHASTYRMAIYYGLQDEESTQTTTIGFGTVTEAYANFGFFGMGAIGCFFAIFFKKISGWSSASPMLSYPGMFMVLLMAWSFQTELTLSDWLGSLYQASVVALGVPFLWRNFLQ
jgi:hypothetical protein